MSHMDNVKQQMPDGTWSYVVPLPRFGLVLKRCPCGRRFLTTKGYSRHYAIRAVRERLGLDVRSCGKVTASRGKKP